MQEVRLEFFAWLMTFADVFLYLGVAFVICWMVMTVVMLFLIADRLGKRDLSKPLKEFLAIRRPFQARHSFKVIGADSKSGSAVDLTIVAGSAAEAEKAASKRGVFVQSVEKVE